jgi:outer membrane protein assembly factor BamE (lipoprotein component of BamABCDE complex)
MVLFQVDGMVDRLLCSVRWSVITLVFIIGGLFLVAYWFSEGHGASLSKLAQVRPGMTRDEVLRLLGNPGTINEERDGSQSWFYTRGTFWQVKVYMDRNGLVEETDHDH